MKYTARLCSNMWKYPPADLLRGAAVPSNFDADLIHSVLASLTPGRMQVVLSASVFQGHTDCVEPIYGKYSCVCMWCVCDVVCVMCDTFTFFVTLFCYCDMMCDTVTLTYFPYLESYPSG